MKHFHIILLALLTAPCIVFAQALPADSAVVILQDTEEPPAGATAKGTLKISDGGFKTKCGYDQTMEEARVKARAKGANLIKITELKSPDAWSTCYRLRADLYYYDQLGALIAEQQAVAAAAIRTMLPDTASYALLCVYRPKTSMGVLVQYNLHVNDSMVCRVKRGGSYMIKLYTTGNTTIWARTESRTEITADIQPGKAYFLRCAVGMGAFVGRPQFNLVSATQGMAEFSQLYGKPEEE